MKSPGVLTLSAPLTLLTVTLLAGGCSSTPFDAGDGSARSTDGGAGGGEGSIGAITPSCPGQEATVTGKVLAPNGQDPVPGASVFIPATVPELFTPTVKCEVCGTFGGADNLWTTTSAFDGTFTLERVCPGTRTLVLQNGRFRRVVKIDVKAGAPLALTADKTRLPKKAGEADPGDSIPKIAVATGDYDKMECVLRKMGLANDAFDLYEGAMRRRSPKKLPAFTDLLADAEKMKQYNIIFINCTDDTFENELKKPQVQDALKGYVQAGGRLYVTDWSYDWIEQLDTLSPFIDFEPGASDGAPEPVNGAAMGKGGLRLDATIKEPKLAQWLGLFPGAATGGTARVEHFLDRWVMIHEQHKDVKVWVEGAVESLDGNIKGQTRPLTVTFNFKNCGKVLFSSYHTEGRELEFLPMAFPQYCGNSASPQDRILEYLIFDIASCVVPIK